LQQLGNVFGVDVNYTLDYKIVCEKIKSAVRDNAVDLIVGTSMGGYMAAQIGSKLGIPFVAINPAITPAKTLLCWEGNHIGYDGAPFTLTVPVINTYPDITTDGCGLVLLDRGDEVISANLTANILRDHFKTMIFVGGNHRFAHMTESISVIKEHYAHAQITYGLDKHA
jgi:predicted esterase YcpF (UPF0227 family)